MLQFTPNRKGYSPKEIIVNIQFTGGGFVDFQHDLAEISRELMRNAKVTISSEWDDCYSCIKYLELHHRWFDSSIPYGVVCSQELLKKLSIFSKADQQAVRDIIHRFKNCIAITPYMSKGIKNTEIKKSDFLLKNWNIYHLHLEKAIRGKPFTNPNLLFFQRKGQMIHLIDIRKHPKGSEWFIRELLEIIYDNWPWLLHYLPGYTPTESIEDCDVHDALKHMVVPIPFRNGMLMPTTSGVASSGDSNLAVKQAYSILNRLQRCEIELEKNEENIRKGIFESMAVQVTEPLDYTLIVEAGFFVAYETHSNAKIRLFETE